MRAVRSNTEVLFTWRALCARTRVAWPRPIEEIVIMPDTIPGGAYQNAQGAWIDAEGRPLSIAKVSEAKKAAVARARQLEADEQARLSLEAQRNPTAQAIAAALAPKPPAKRATAAPDLAVDDDPPDDAPDEDTKP